MMNTNTPLQALFEKARAHEPFGEPGSFGFETRLRAALTEPIPSSFEMLGKLSWRFTLACLPFVFLGTYLVTFQQSGFLPEGLGGVVSQWTVLLPGDFL